MKDGKISDNELEQTKAVLRNQLLETVETARGFIEMLYQNVVGGREITIDQWLEAVERTTKEEVVSAAGKVEMDTIYFLSGTEGE